jgi:hypothetical protein
MRGVSIILIDDGDPKKRDPERVLADVLDGLASLSMRADMAVDRVETATLRGAPQVACAVWPTDFDPM